jgi:hypothetical protein
MNTDVIENGRAGEMRDWNGGGEGFGRVNESERGIHLRTLST